MQALRKTSCLKYINIKGWLHFRILKNCKIAGISPFWWRHRWTVIGQRWLITRLMWETSPVWCFMHLCFMFDFDKILFNNWLKWWGGGRYLTISNTCIVLYNFILLYLVHALDDGKVVGPLGDGRYWRGHWISWQSSLKEQNNVLYINCKYCTCIS